MLRHHKVENNKVVVHLGGTGYGEGILVIIGGTILLGIDCPKTFLLDRDPEKTFLQELINQLKGDKRVYWLLTHYHLDHFLLLDALLKNHGEQIDSFVHPANLTQADIRWLIENELERDEEEGLKLGSALKRLRDEMSKEPTRSIRKIAGSPYETWVSMSLNIKNLNISKELKIVVYSPSPVEMDKMEGKELIKTMAEDPKERRPRSIGNKTSYVVCLSFGNFEALFLGDAPFGRTESINWKATCIDRGLSVLKVSHHGSKTGTSTALLQALEGKERIAERKALIAPFSARDLPNCDIIKMLRKAHYDVLISGKKRASKKEKEAYEKDGEGIVTIHVEDACRPGYDIITLEFEA